MNSTLIIAEAGVNHNGDLDTALRLVDAAADSGADVVKFQTFKATQLVSSSAKKAEYQITNDPSSDSTQLEMLKKLELPEEWHFILKKRAEDKGIIFTSTGFDHSSITFLDKLGVPFFKIPSGEITNKPLIEFIANKGKEVILSTGMATMEEINDAVQVLFHAGLNKEQITILHCNTEYPTPMNDVNLMAMHAIYEKFNIKVGYSDHTLGIEIPIAAVALGAKVIEKHFTLDRKMEGPDHIASLEPHELKAMVTAIRNVERAISGSGLKEPSESEKKNIDIARKSIHYASNLNENSIISLNDLIMLRPGSGISPMQIDEVVGKSLAKSVQVGDQLSWEDLK
jgi:N-acetylneuraminate synthase/N,N'-diacetyllegionaminate synthase